MSDAIEFGPIPFDWSAVQEQHDPTGKVVGYFVPAEVMRKLVEERHRFGESACVLLSEVCPPPTEAELEEMRSNPKSIHEVLQELEEMMTAPEVVEAKP